MPADGRPVFGRGQLETVGGGAAETADLSAQLTPDLAAGQVTSDPAATAAAVGPPSEGAANQAALSGRLVDKLVREAAEEATEQRAHPVHLRRDSGDGTSDSGDAG